MERITTKEKILRNIRGALLSKEENPFHDIDFSSAVYNDFDDDKEVVFAQQFIDKGGNFIYCENEKAFVENLKTLQRVKEWGNIFAVDEKLTSLLDNEGFEYDSDIDNFKNIKTGITRCEFLIARFGSILVSSALSSGRRMFGYPEIHLVMAYTSQVVPEIKDALKQMRKKYDGELPSQITMITGPSRTADIEKTLVMGAHGPRELYLFLIDE
jgi:L-lactate dehydrogenase complex protein LldG